MPNYATLLREAVRTSGLTAEKYFKTVLMRNPRTGRRWLRGDAPIPQAVREFLTRPSIGIPKGRGDMKTGKARQ